MVTIQIRVSEKVKSRLDKLGSKGDTYNNIVERLLKKAGK